MRANAFSKLPFLAPMQAIAAIRRAVPTPFSEAKVAPRNLSAKTTPSLASMLAVITILVTIILFSVFLPAKEIMEFRIHFLGKTQVNPTSMGMLTPLLEKMLVTRIQVQATTPSSAIRQVTQTRWVTIARYSDLPQVKRRLLVITPFSEPGPDITTPMTPITPSLGARRAS
jgi:hypothetical protein